MPTSNIYVLREIEVVGGSPVYLVQCTQRSVDPALDLAINKASGMPEPSWVSVMNVKPMLSFSTTEITRAFTLMDYQAGCAIGAGLTYTALNAYFAKAADLGVRTSGSVNMKVANDRGLLIPTELSVAQGGEATIGASFYATATDGVTAPTVVTTGSAASAATMEADQKYTLAKCSINGTTVNGVIGWSISFWAKHLTVSSDGGPYPKFCFIQDSDPIIKIRTNDAQNLSTFGLIGTAVSSASDFYLGAMSKAGVRVANATTSHIRVRAYQGLVTVGAVSASGNNPAECELTITPYKTGSNFLLVSTGVAIT